MIDVKQKQATDLFACLSSGVRLDIFRRLVRAGKQGLVPGELAAELDLAGPNLSFHLKSLLHADLVTVEQEGRFQRYRANIPLMLDMVAYLTENCCGDRPQDCADLRCGTPAAVPFLPSLSTRMTTHTFAVEKSTMSKTYTVLFICTGNSARSQLAEVLLNTHGQGRFKAFSAGSRPAGSVSPLALETLENSGYPSVGLRSKSWDEFAGPDAPPIDFVFTLCDTAAGEECPVWPGQPIRAHWGIPDPGHCKTEDERRKAFRDALLTLKRRIDLLTALPLDKLDDLALKHRVMEIGQGV